MHWYDILIQGYLSSKPSNDSMFQSTCMHLALSARENFFHIQIPMGYTLCLYKDYDY